MNDINKAFTDFLMEQLQNTLQHTHFQLSKNGSTLFTIYTLVYQLPVMICEIQDLQGILQVSISDNRNIKNETTLLRLLFPEIISSV